jgi:two-component system nitrate/nitrite response regulator NarL
MAMRLLIVDDNAHFLRAAQDMLEGEGMIVVGVASTSAEALQLTRGLQPDVVLVDVDLGEESGFDLAERLAAREDRSVVLISAYPEAELAELITASPAAGFISKTDLSARAVSDVLAHFNEIPGRR